jgi:dienelactone hydrolase
MNKVSRRDVGKIVAGLAAAQTLPIVAAADAPQQRASGSSSSYIGPLTGVDPAKVADRHFDPVAYTRELYAAAPRQLRFQARTRDEAGAWQVALRARLVELLGGFPATRIALRPLTLETREFPGYRREKIVFDTRPGVSVIGYVLFPKNAKTPAPAMICVPGHGRGVDDIVGIDDKGNDRTDKSGYQHDFALQVVESGLAAVAIEPLAFGARRDEITAKKGAGTTACQPAAGGALLVGQTMIGWRVWDVMRTIDYIETRPELDRSRVGVVGISGGGTASLFSAAVEQRLKVAYVSGYLNTFRDCIGSLSHCIDNYVPGILNWAEMHDIAGLIAPRPLFVESGEKDNIFPIQASIESFNLVRQIYSVFGAAERVEQEIFPAEHSFWGKRGIPFTARHLNA